VTGSKVTGHVGDPVCAISDALHRVRGRRDHHLDPAQALSRWMKLDLPSKVRIDGLPVTHVVGERAPSETAAGQAA
jgi:hypothetical protein